MRPTRIVLAATLVAVAAQPLLAGVVYVPGSFVTQDGILRQSKVVLSNPDPNAIQGVKYRFIDQNDAGTPLPPGDLPVFFVTPNGTSVYNVPTSTLPVGHAGMLEIVPGANMVVSGRMRYQKTGVFGTTVDLPAISSGLVRPAGTSLYLQGVEHDGQTDTLTDIGAFNVGTTAANCTIAVNAADGTVLAPDTAFTIPALSSQMYADLFGTGGSPITVPRDSWAKVTCDQQFWVYAVRLNVVTGEARVIEGTDSLAQSSLQQPGGDPPPPPPGGQYSFQLPGTFLTCTSSNKYWKTSLDDGRVHNQTFHKIVVDFDVYQNNWDSNHTVHIYMWLQNGQSWSSDLFGYLVAIRGRNKFRFSLKFGSGASVDTGPGPQVGNTYHVHYEWDGTTRQVWYRVTKNGNTVNTRSVALNKSTFSVHGMFLGLGSWPTNGGPEALQYGWRYSNMAVDYTP
jgi:hypothetical protein